MVRYANKDDLELLSKYDKHISKEELENVIKLSRVILIFENDTFIGWLRYGLFWDNIPFMNMLYIIDGYRGKGYGKKIVNFWEKEMKEKGFNLVLTSTQSDEQGQFFYRKNGYKDIGDFILPGEASELILYKEL